MLTKGLVVHKEVAEVAIAVDAVEPAREGFCSERPFGPAPIGKTKSAVVTQAIIFQPHRKRSLPTGCQGAGRTVHIIWTSSITQQAVNAFAADAPEPAVGLQPIRQPIVVGQLGVAEERRRDPKG